MSRLTLRLPDSLHKTLARHAEREGVSLNQYLVYLLAQRSTSGYDVELKSEAEVARQEEGFSQLLAELGPASHSEVRAALEVREATDPDPGLTPEVVERIRQRIEESGGGSEADR